MKELLCDLSCVFGFGVFMTAIAAAASGALHPEPIDYTKQAAYDIRKLRTNDLETIRHFSDLSAATSLGSLPVSVPKVMGR